MRRKIAKFMGICMFPLLISGCHSKDIAPPAIPETTEESSVQVEEREPVETIPNEAESETQKYVYVPDQFSVYNDGEAHKLLYSADEEYYHYCSFTNIALPEYGYESISLPSSLVPTGENVITLSDGIELKNSGLENMDPGQIVNDSAQFSSEKRNIYSLRTPGMYMFHAWTEDYLGEIHTLTLRDFAGILKIGGSITSDFEDIEILDDGSTRYTCAYKDDREYTGDNVPYYGKAVVRLKDGKAWCAIFAEKDHADGPRMAAYVLKQSAVYAEEGTNE
ncbi:hypothetical protein QMP26_41650 (plasmid) [Enterocloster clostridioformis]